MRSLRHQNVWEATDQKHERLFQAFHLLYHMRSPVEQTASSVSSILVAPSAATGAATLRRAGAAFCFTGYDGFSSAAREAYARRCFRRLDQSSKDARRHYKAGLVGLVYRERERERETESPTDCYKTLLMWASWVNTLCWKHVFAIHGLPHLCVWVMSDVLCGCAQQVFWQALWMLSSSRMHTGLSGPSRVTASLCQRRKVMRTPGDKRLKAPRSTTSFAISFQNLSELLCGINMDKWGVLRLWLWSHMNSYDMFFPMWPVMEPKKVCNSLFAAWPHAWRIACRSC